MRLTEIIRSMLLSVAANIFRVFLTSLGIIIGTFTIIMVVGIGRASADAVEEQYKRLSVETITINRAAAGGPGGGFRISAGGGASGVSFGKSLTKDMAMDMPYVLNHVRDAGVSTVSSSPVVYGSVSETAAVAGITESYADITRLNAEYGDMFSDDDGISRNKVAVLGYDIAYRLFGEDYPYCIGEKVYIKGLSFTVIGVLERVGSSGGVSGASAGGRGVAALPDETVYVPYEVALKYTSGGAGSRGGVNIAMVNAAASTTFVALASSISEVDAAISEIQDYIFGIVGDYTSYSVVDAGQTLTSALETSNTMSALLMVVAAIVLIVSGIGIMNVLMVAVKEREREIGILKAIGAQRSAILLMFLAEAVFISVIGGALGAGLSGLAPFLLSYLNVEYTASLYGLLLGFLFSVITGVFFGYYPAYKASKLRPIEALNSE